jgi:hypothetical protein
VNLDGNIRGRGFQPISGDDGGKEPFLWIEKSGPPLSDSALKQMGLPREKHDEMMRESERLMRSVRGGGIRVKIAQSGIDHLDFSDNPYWRSGAGGAKLRTLQITREYLRAFLTGALQENWAIMRKLLADSTLYPEVSVASYGAFGK